MCGRSRNNKHVGVDPLRASEYNDDASKSLPPMHTVSTENCTSLHERLLTKSNAGCFVCVIIDLAWDWTYFQRLYFLPSIVFAALASKLSMMTEWQPQEGARLLANSKTVLLSTADLFSCRIGFSASPTRPCWSLFCFY